MRHPVIRPLFVVLAALLVLGVPAPAALAVAPSAGTVLPALTGTARDGQQLRISNGAWNGTTPLTYNYRWQRCDATGGACALISGQLTSTYLLTAADVGGTIRGVVTATNADGAATQTSAPSAEVTPRAAPVNAAPPVVAGTERDGETLSSSDGTWSGTAPITYTRRWMRCDVAGANCTSLSGTSTSLRLSSAEVGYTLRLQVTATNADGTGFVMSAATGVIDGAAPVNTVLPSTGGTPREGQQVSLANIGSWSGTIPMGFTRQWERCNESGLACASIAGATQTTYPVAVADIGSTIRLRVTATNSEGSLSAWSAVTPVVTAKAPPVNDALPALSGTAMDDQTLTVTNGVWTGTAPITYVRRWQRCDAAGDNCLDLAATGTSLKLAPSDTGSTVRVRVTATNPDGTAVVVSDPSAVVAPAPPVNTTGPAIVGTLREGQLLTAGTGTWKGTPTIGYAHQWYRCDAAATCASIAGATASTYRLGLADVGQHVRASVTASNAATDVTAWTSLSAVVTQGPPASVDAPGISGALARDGQTWAGALGTWAGTATIVYDRQWVRCSNTGMACVPISGEIGTTYRFAAADVGRTVRLEVTAANGQGTTKVSSVASPVVAAAAPVADTPPTITGTARDGQQLVAAPGAWSGTAPIVFTYRWQRCDAVTSICSDIAGATADRFTLDDPDVGSSVRVRVGASNAGGGGNATSAQTALVQPQAPATTGVPVVTGTAKEGATLTTTTGAFSGTGPFTYTYQWQRCDDQGASCAAIAGATASTYVLVAADRFSTLRSIVTATNGSGSDSAISTVTGVVALAAPANVVPPSVSPDTGLKDGRLVTSTEGAWSGSAPLEISYQWQRCNPAGTGCTNIAGATEASYRLSTAEVGFTVRALVTAANGAGGATQASLPTGAVLTNPPVNDVLPTISGTAVDGGELVAAAGDWTGLVPFTTTFRWWRCDAAGGNCGLVAGASGSTYALTPADVGLTIRAQVLMANAGGTTAATSGASGVVLPAPPVSVVAPQVLGGAAVGRTVAASPGTWRGTPEVRFSYQWQRCDASGGACGDIPGATTGSYLLVGSDDEMTVRVIVTAENDIGTAIAVSPTTNEVSDDPPIAIIDPSVSTPGLVTDGAVLTVDPGVWGGLQPITYAYQWRRCDAAGLACIDIAGATTAGYPLTKDDVGKRVVAVVTATNIVSSVVAQTSATPIVLPEPPSNLILPAVTAAAAARDGVRLTATTGNWKGAAPITYATTWLRCDAGGASCAPIPNVSGSSYTLTGDDVGARVRARVTAGNAATEVEADSIATAVVAAAAPSNTTKPSVTPMDGKAVVGGRLRANTGAWTGTAPLDLAVQWQRCLGTSLAACDDIPDATGAEYLLSEADVGRRVRVSVTATNVAGTARTDSLTTEAVPALAPENAAPPAIVAGTAREGAELRAVAGSWAGSAPMTLAFQWERCATAAATTCPKITGATKATYSPVALDVGKVVRVTVIATNAAGKAQQASGVSEEISGVAPRNVSPPGASVKGDLKVGGTLTSTNGTWAGTAPMTYTVRWQRCDARGEVCADIAAATKPVYTLKADDLNGVLLKSPIRAVVTALNSAGQADATTAALGAVVAAAATAPGAGGPAVARKPRKRLPRSKAALAFRKLQITTKGRIRVTLTCVRKSKDLCGSTGSFTSGRIAAGLSVNGIARGKSITKIFVLTKGQRAALRGRRTVRFVVRISAPATPTRSKVRKVTVKIPGNLAGKLRAATRTTATKKKPTAKQRAAARRRAAAGRKAAATKAAAKTPV